MPKPLATLGQRVRDKLLNRKVVACAVCDRYITPYAGIPVILGVKDQIIEFAHPACCVPVPAGTS